MSIFCLDQHHELAEQNKRTFPDLENTQIIACLRRPSSHYLARLQQRLKAAHNILAAERIAYPARLAGWESAGNLQLCEFNKAALHSRDVVQDFWKRTLGSLPLPSGQFRHSDYEAGLDRSGVCRVCLLTFSVF